MQEAGAEAEHPSGCGPTRRQLWGWVVRFSVGGTSGGHRVIPSAENRLNKSKEARACEERMGERAVWHGPRVWASEQWETMLDPSREHRGCWVKPLA